MAESTLRAALDAALRVLQRAARHLDVDGDCWFSCSTLTCDVARRSAECDCGADKAQAALALIESALHAVDKRTGQVKP